MLAALGRRSFSYYPHLRIRRLDTSGALCRASLSPCTLQIHMKLFQSLALLASSALLSVTPTLASTRSTTADLLHLLDNSGITVVIDNYHCTGDFHGAYHFSGIARRMVICTGDDGFDAEDHDTVRHETIHALQHCKNSILERPSNTPLMEPDEVIAHAEDVLTEAQIKGILNHYPEEYWLVELEAFAGAQVLSAADLMELFNDVCLMEA